MPFFSLVSFLSGGVTRFQVLGIRCQETHHCDLAHEFLTLLLKGSGRG